MTSNVVSTSIQINVLMSLLNLSCPKMFWILFFK